MLQGDIAQVRADALVNASNTMLRLGSGVSAALRKACGPGLQAEMDRIGGVTANGIAVTGAHDLGTRGVRHVLHVPTASGGEVACRTALANVLATCTSMKLRSVGIPLLGTGTGGLDPELFAALAVDALRGTAAPAHGCRVVFAAWSSRDHVAMGSALHRAEGVVRVEAEGSKQGIQAG